jgi:hypothetical protein
VNFYGIHKSKSWKLGLNLAFVTKVLSLLSLENG